jgi:hypothetical protein
MNYDSEMANFSDCSVPTSLRSLLNNSKLSLEVTSYQEDKGHCLENLESCNFVCLSYKRSVSHYSALNSPLSNIHGPKRQRRPDDETC